MSRLDDPKDSRVLRHVTVEEFKFSDLVFVTIPERHNLDYTGAKICLLLAANGYGASILAADEFKGTYSLAIVMGTLDSYTTCYDTPITDVLLQQLSPRDVESYIKMVLNLPDAPFLCRPWWDVAGKIEDTVKGAIASFRNGSMFR